MGVINTTRPVSLIVNYAYILFNVLLLNFGNIKSFINHRYSIMIEDHKKAILDD